MISCSVSACTQAGTTVVDLQVAGRWKSSQMPAHYAKAELAERGAIVRFKDEKIMKKVVKIGDNP